MAHVNLPYDHDNINKMSFPTNDILDKGFIKMFITHDIVLKYLCGDIVQCFGRGESCVRVYVSRDL